MVFKDCLKLGFHYEELAVNYFKSIGYNHILDSNYKNKCSEYDILISKDNIEKKIEVKSDRLSSKTGNIFIEYECNSKPSGITTSESDLYIYFIIKNIGYDMYIIPTNGLRELIKDKKYFRVVSGGDKNYSKGYLFKLFQLSKYKYIDMLD